MARPKAIVLLHHWPLGILHNQVNAFHLRSLARPRTWGPRVAAFAAVDTPTEKIEEPTSTDEAIVSAKRLPVGMYPSMNDPAGKSTIAGDLEP